MRKDTLFLATPLIGGAFGLFLRWLQCSIIFDEGTGLAARGAGMSWALIVFCIAFAIICFFGVWKQDTPRFAAGRTVFGGSKALCLINAVMGALTALAGVMTALSAHDENRFLWLIFAVLVIFFGLSVMALALNKGSEALRALFCAVPILTCCFWLILFYKINANEPVLWKFAMDFLAICANTLAWYFVAGFQYDAPKPAKTLFFIQIAVFLDILVMADNRPFSMRMIFLCPAIVLLCMSIRLLCKDKVSEE